MSDETPESESKKVGRPPGPSLVRLSTCVYPETKEGLEAMVDPGKKELNSVGKVINQLVKEAQEE